MATPLGFIGLGAMGSRMARHLLAAGYPLTVWARRDAQAEALCAAGATRAGSPAAVAAASRHVFLCVTDTAAVEAVVFGDNGIAACAAHDGVLVDHSTIAPLASRGFAARLAERNGMQWVDAPVSGGEAGAEAGELVVMAGGAAAALAAVEAPIGCYAKRLTHMGDSGAGQATKTVNQMLIGGAVAVAAEALNLADRFGVDAAQVPDALAGGWADSTVLQNHARRMIAAAYPDTVDARLMAKDIDIACDLGRACGAPLPVTALVQQLYRELIADGDCDKGQIGLMWLYRQQAL